MSTAIAGGVSVICHANIMLTTVYGSWVAPTVHFMDNHNDPRRSIEMPHSKMFNIYMHVMGATQGTDRVFTVNMVTVASLLFLFRFRKVLIICFG